MPVAADVIDALSRLAGICVETPVLRSDRLDDLVHGRVLLKCESLQRTGAFKFRGAYNRLSRLDRQAFPDGVVAYSTGNHGQAVATVARLLGIPATIVMPNDAPAIKIAKARAQNADVVLYDRRTQSREAIATQIASARAVDVVPPGDDPHVIAGQGTVAGETLQRLGSNAADIIVVPCGGGGLAAGTCLAAEVFNCKAEIWAAEPQDFDDTRRSLASGAREKNDRLQGSICDALLAPTPAELPFSINRKRLGAVLVADDTAVMAAMRLAYDEFRVVTEPGGAVALASLLQAPDLLKGRTALVVASGGNVDRDLFVRAITQTSKYKE